MPSGAPYDNFHDDAHFLNDLIAVNQFLSCHPRQAGTCGDNDEKLINQADSAISDHARKSRIEATGALHHIIVCGMIGSRYLWIRRIVRISLNGWVKS
jgi:hypothetical protein